MKKEFKNPILSGFYPDPSICRAGEDYYLVTSSFVYFPGLPVFHSRDLVHWEQIGHGLTAENTFDYKNCETSLGLWAPTIRYHEGTFYIINTFVSEGREARRDNFIITATDPAGPWSQPVFIKGADGIDSSLFFDEDGSMWYAGNFIYQEQKYEGHHGIYLCELDRDSFQFKRERMVIWDGSMTYSKWIEAPHIYKKDNYYYLMVAEGGTFVDHSVMIAKAEIITGPYRPCPHNPIVSHRHLPINYPISVVGHGDLFETQNHEWWMVLLGVRNYEEHHFNTGRETFLLPMTWKQNDWPMADSRNGLVNETERVPRLPAYYPVSGSRCDQFENEQLSMMWNTIHPPGQPFYSLTDRKGWLKLKLLPEVMEEICCPAFVGRRQQDGKFLVRTVMAFQPEQDGEEAGICLVQDDRYHCSLVKTRRGNVDVIRLYSVIGSVMSLVREINIRTTETIYLTVDCLTDTYRFYYGFAEGEYLPAGELPANILSSWTNEGFTGAYIGMYATANGQESQNAAYYDWFLYEGI